MLILLFEYLAEFFPIHLVIRKLEELLAFNMIRLTQPFLLFVINVVYAVVVVALLAIFIIVRKKKLLLRSSFPNKYEILSRRISSK